jgi:disulfide bond formation protein DsbB
MENQPGGNLFLASVVALIFVVGVAAVVWVAQVGPPVTAEASTQAVKGNPVAGQELFSDACASCHGSVGEGVVGLAQDMRASAFIASQTDAALVEFIKAGRNPGDPHNVTGVGMPAKGGNPALSDQNLYDLVAHVRTLQPGELPAPAQTSGPAQTSKGDTAAGQTAFTATCSACHGPTGEGVQGLGKDLTTSEFVAGLNDDELVAFIKVGRPTSDPLNTTKIDMPPKGGNPALSDDDLYNIVAHLRSISK